MRVFALTSSQVASETLDLFLTREAAEAELREILKDEPEWVDVLSVVQIELDGRRRVGELAAVKQTTASPGHRRHCAAVQVLVIAVTN